MLNFEKINLIASKVRKVIERHAKKLDHPDDLNGMCAIASGVLHEVFKHHGIESKIVSVYDEDEGGHCFVKIHEHIIDITATQFTSYNKEFSEVTVLHPNDKNRNYWFYGYIDGTESKLAIDIFKTNSGLRNFQKAEGWTSDQVAFDYRKMLKLKQECLNEL